MSTSDGQRIPLENRCRFQQAKDEGRSRNLDAGPPTKSASKEYYHSKCEAVGIKKAPSAAGNHSSERGTDRIEKPGVFRSVSASSRAYEKPTFYGHEERQLPILSRTDNRGAKQLFAPSNNTKRTGNSRLSRGARFISSLTKKRTYPPEREEESSTQESTTLLKNKLLPQETAIKRRKVSEELPSRNQNDFSQRVISPSSSSEEIFTSAPGRKKSKMESIEKVLASHYAALPHVNYGNPTAHPNQTQYHPLHSNLHSYDALNRHLPLLPPQSGPYHHGISQPQAEMRYLQSLPGQSLGGYPPPYPTFYTLNHPSEYPQSYHSTAMQQADAADLWNVQPPQYTVADESLSAADTRVNSNKFHEYANTVGRNIKFIAELQEEALATGRVASANRCIPLKEPIASKSKSLSRTEDAEDSPIPDFFQLVNFPDHLKKARSAAGSYPSESGKRTCVMCGKQRPCSSSAANLGGSSTGSLRRRDGKENKDDNTVPKHIIPTQNKGLCTACDVKVWVFVSTGVEIKWCKGCKNFRSWAAFGIKGTATKCLRCRNRQREKYALQKEELRLRRKIRRKPKPTEREHDIAAAQGLRDLMAAAPNNL